MELNGIKELIKAISDAQVQAEHVRSQVEDKREEILELGFTDADRHQWSRYLEDVEYVIDNLTEIDLDDLIPNQEVKR